MKVSKNSLISRMIEHPFMVFFSKSWWPLPETSCMYFLRGVLTGLFNVLMVFSLIHSVLSAGIIFSSLYLGIDVPLKLTDYINYIINIGGIFYVTALFMIGGLIIGFMAPTCLIAGLLILIINKVLGILSDSSVLKTGIKYLWEKVTTSKKVNMFLLKVHMYLIPIKIYIKKVYKNTHNKLCKKMDYEEK